jgi:hypothetical protein
LLDHESDGSVIIDDDYFTQVNTQSEPLRLQLESKVKRSWHAICNLS